MTYDQMSKDAEITVSPTLHFECPACGADIVKDFIYIRYADTVYISCPYCRVTLEVKIAWYAKGEF